MDTTETERRVEAATEILNDYAESVNDVEFEYDTVVDEEGVERAEIWLQTPAHELETLVYTEPFDENYPQDNPEKVADWVGRVLHFEASRLQDFSRKIGKDLHGNKDYG